MLKNNRHYLSKSSNLMLSIMPLSESGEWKEAQMEWTIADIYESDPAAICACGRSPIYNVCILLNHKNGNTAIAGTCCTHKFMGLPSDKIFSSIKRVRKNKGHSLNREAAQFALNKMWIGKSEYDFIVNTMGSRTLSESQLLWRERINKKVMINIKRTSLNKSFESKL